MLNEKLRDPAYQPDEVCYYPRHLRHAIRWAFAVFDWHFHNYIENFIEQQIEDEKAKKRLEDKFYQSYKDRNKVRFLL